MSGNDLIRELSKLTPEQLEFPVIHTHTEYQEFEDSMGSEVDCDVESVRVKVYPVKGKNLGNIILGY